MSQSSQNSKHNQQIQNEVDERMMQLEETMTKIQIDKENKLRQIEYDYMQSTEQIKTEVKKKNEYLKVLEEMNNFEIQARQNALNEVNDDRVNGILHQKKEIDKSLKFEKQEQIRLQKVIEKKQFEHKLMNLKLMEDAHKKDEEKKIRQMNLEMEKQQRDLERINYELRNKEKDIMEKQKFNELLSHTDDNLRKMEEEKIMKENMKLKQKVDAKVHQKRIEREEQMLEMVREREVNFQEFTVRRQKQIENEYKDTLDQYQGEKDRDRSNERNPMLSPDKTYSEINDQSRSALYSPGSENMNPNKQKSPFSDLSNSMNQKYLNKDAYPKTQTQNCGTLKDQIIAIKGALALPLMEQHQAIRSELQSMTSDEGSRMDQSSVYSATTDDESDPVIQKHEQSKYAFEEYKRSSDGTNFRGMNNSSLPIKDSTFGAPNDSSQDFKHKLSMNRPIPFASMDGAPFDGQEIRSHNGLHDGQFSSVITEENSVETSEECSSQNLSMTSDNSLSYYSKHSQNDISNSKSYDMLPVRSNSNIISPDRSNNYESTSNVSLSPSDAGVNMYEQNQKIGGVLSSGAFDYSLKHSQKLEDMSINPFYNPNPAFVMSGEWKVTD
jgi:hypothetical protein